MTTTSASAFPRTSVIIPSYNTGKFILNAVESAFSTKYPNLEIVIVDDGSSDNSLDLLSAYIAGRPDDNIKLHTHPGNINKGIAATRNYAIAKSTGKYLTFLDADDLFLPNRFDVCIPLMENDPEIEAVCEPFYYLYVSGERGRKLHGDGKARLLRSSGPQTGERGSEEIFKDLLASRNVPHTTSITIRAGILKETGLFPTHLKYCMEKPFWMKICARNRVKDVNREPISKYILHEASTCARNEENADFLFENIESLIDAYLWMASNNITAGYVDAMRELILAKFYHYCSIVLQHPHSFFRDVIMNQVKMARVFPVLLSSLKFWKVSLRLPAAKIGIARKW